MLNRIESRKMKFPELEIGKVNLLMDLKTFGKPAARKLLIANHQEQTNLN